MTLNTNNDVVQMSISERGIERLRKLYRCAYVWSRKRHWKSYRCNVADERMLKEPVKCEMIFVEDIFQTAARAVLPQREMMRSVQTKTDKLVQVIVAQVSHLENDPFIIKRNWIAGEEQTSK